MKKISKEIRKVVQIIKKEKKIEISSRQYSIKIKNPEQKFVNETLKETSKKQTKPENLEEQKETSKEQKTPETLEEQQEISKENKNENIRYLEDLTIEESKEKEVIKLKNLMFDNRLIYRKQMNNLTDKELKIFFNSQLSRKSKNYLITNIIVALYNLGIIINMSDQNKQSILEFHGINYDQIIKFIRILKMGIIIFYTRKKRKRNGI
jgi:hypothetical protein